MASETFTAKQTSVKAAWCNEVDNLVHTIFGNPTAEKIKLETNGDFYIGPSASPALFIDVSLNKISLGNNLTTESVILELGRNRVGDGNCFIDLVTDTTYTDYGLRINRTAGANANSFIDHRGTGDLIAKVTEAGSFSVRTNNITALTVDSSQNVGIGISTPDTNLHVWNGSAGAVSAPAATTLLTLENNSNAWISFLSPNTGVQGLKFGDPDNNTSGLISYDHTNKYISIFVEGTTNCRVDDDATAGNTRLLIYDVDNATLERVSVGAADSGGAGFKLLRIPN